MNPFGITVLKVKHYGTKEKAYIPCIGTKTLGKIWFTKTLAQLYAHKVLARYRELLAHKE